jgi:hypothetical protein
MTNSLILENVSKSELKDLISRAVSEEMSKKRPGNNLLTNYRAVIDHVVADIERLQQSGNPGAIRQPLNYSKSGSCG